ncbi:Chromosomal replication initiator protein DnaA [Bacillus mobilis]|uniref:Chromosomal replication initiator protein DnaA n=1 Tax=Bacillus mobilis TaxID=2026190 RepID=A0A1Y6B083_9BACI|nr:DnaA N-terminal domain-containing protein [Bacillus mobilis]SME52400.1 Chromosomal replication initiator protein DnaA [Bacillus mobilis]
MKINWTEVKEKIRTQISKPSYETWFTNTTVYLEDDILTIYCPNEFARDWLESHYKELVFHTLREMFNTTFEIQFDLCNGEPHKLNDIQKERLNSWDDVKKALRPKLAEKTFMTWIRNTNATIEDNTLIIFCEDAFHRDLLEGEYKNIISSTVQNLTNKEYQIWFEIESKTTSIAQILNMQNHPLTSEQEESNTIWDEIKDKIQLTISRPSYETWVKETTARINENSLIIYSENEFQQGWVEKSYKDLISQIAKELTGNTYELQFELESNKDANINDEKLKLPTENTIFELWEQFKSSNDELKYNNVLDSEKRIQALEEKIVNLEKVIDTLVGKLDVAESKTQLEK